MVLGDQRRFPCYMNSQGIVQYDVLSKCHEYDFTIMPEFSEDGLKERVQKLERVLRVYFLVFVINKLMALHNAGQDLVAN